MYNVECPRIAIQNESCDLPLTKEYVLSDLGDGEKVHNKLGNPARMALHIISRNLQDVQYLAHTLQMQCGGLLFPCTNFASARSILQA